MPIEKSVGGIVFRREGDRAYFLLLHYPGLSHRAKKDYWDFPKGHMEKGESEIETLKREIKEETGLENIKVAKGFREEIRYFFKFQGKNILKFVVFYLVEADRKNIKISFEHKGYQWLEYKEALKTLGFENAKELLKKANQFLKSYASKKI